MLFDKDPKHLEKARSFGFSMLGQQVRRLSKCIGCYKYLINMVYQPDQSFVVILVEFPQTTMLGDQLFISCTYNKKHE